MKVIAIILSGLVLQTSASFFDEFRGAVSSVESSFGKLLTDVIYDVKETIDCTLLAVEQALSFGMIDTADYDRRCRDGTEVAEEPVVEIQTEPPPPPVQETQYIAIPLTKVENRQIDTSLLDVNQVLCDVLKKDDTYAQLESVKIALKDDTARLTEISDLLRKQLGELYAEVQGKFKAIELQTSEPSVESIWNDIKLLHEIEHKHKNTDEAKKISHILDQILNILDSDKEDRSAADDYKIKEIMRKLSKQTKGGDSDIWNDAKDYPKDFRDYAKKIFDEQRSTPSPEGTTKKPEPGQDKEEDIKKKDESDKKDSKGKHENTKEMTTVKPKGKKKPKRTTTTTTEKPLTIEELAAEYGSLFDVMPDIDSFNAKQAHDSAKKIIEDAKLNDAVMDSLAQIESSKEARNLFDDPDYLDDDEKYDEYH